MALRDSPGATLRLRSDKVAVRLVDGVRSALRETVPEGVAVVFTVTAPIREPSKTKSALIEIIRTRFSLGAMLGDYAEAVYGNQVRVRLVTSQLPCIERVTGFVHNPNSSIISLLDVAQSLIECLETSEVAETRDTTINLQTLQRLCGQLFDTNNCAKILAALDQRSTRKAGE